MSDTLVWFHNGSDKPAIEFYQPLLGCKGSDGPVGLERDGGT
jgi:hypothetical protein